MSVEIKSKDVTMVDIGNIIDNPKNPNRHSIEQIERLAKIIKYNGFRDPLIVSNRTGFLLCGHGRKAAAEKLGMRQLPVSYQDFESEAEEYQFMTAHNEVARWAELDMQALYSELGSLTAAGIDLDLLGIDGFTLPSVDKLPEGDPDDVPELKPEAVTKRGDVWVLGRHRVMCGDSTMIDDVERLMNGEKADLWLTDPPYGVAYQSNGAEDKHDKIENDDLPMEEMGEFWTSVASNALMVCSDKASYYWFACQGGDQMMMMMMMMSIGRANWKVRHELIWVKDSLVMGRCDYHYKHEPILYGWKQNGTHVWNSDRKQTSVLEFPRPKKSEEHPTMKPVDLFKYLMGNNTTPGQVVLDTFGGSGTTVVAAEAIGREARLIELSPKYVDVTIRRWQALFGGKAVLESTGEAFNDLDKNDVVQ